MTRETMAGQYLTEETMVAIGYKLGEPGTINKNGDAIRPKTRKAEYSYNIGQISVGRGRF